MQAKLIEVKFTHLIWVSDYRQVILYLYWFLYQGAVEESRHESHQPLQTAGVAELEAVQHDKVGAHDTSRHGYPPRHVDTPPWQAAREASIQTE